MIALIQRVTEARVLVDGEIIGRIGPGMAVLIGMERTDDDARADRLIDRLLGYRLFADEAGRMNRSLSQTGGGLLLVPNFTLAADTAKGTRPSFTPALSPDRAEPLFNYLLERAIARHRPVSAGRFGAHMRVQLTNDGPVTLRLTV